MDPIFWDFRRVLQFEFERRKRKNQKFSIRSYAKFLGVDPSYLFRIMRAQRPITEELISNFCHRLGISDVEAKQYRTALATQSNLKSGVPFIFIYEGEVLRVLGSVSLELANRHLAQHGLCAVDAGNVALACAGVHCYSLTSEGPYVEAYFAFLVKDLNSGAIGYVFDHTHVSSPGVAGKYVHDLGVPQTIASAEISRGASGLPSGIVTPHLNGKLKHTSEAEFMPAIENSMATVFTLNVIKTANYKILVDNIVRRRPFDPRKDVSNVVSRSPLEETLAKLGGFVPVEWQWIPRFKAVMFRPD
jgi:transcriptional regulator with XRE-family HTH domain